MIISNYIESVIDNHQKEFDVYFTRIARDEIKRCINSGIYAFQIIYAERNGKYVVSEIKYLDYKLCVHESRINRPMIPVFSMMWSYDGGQRYQWSERETLVFDPSEIRNIKIESIL